MSRLVEDLLTLARAGGGMPLRASTVDVGELAHEICRKAGAQHPDRNIPCAVLPPGFSLVDAYGGCPPFAVKAALPLMMHVWVVDNPGGPFADGVPDTWTRPFNRAHGVPFAW